MTEKARRSHHFKKNSRVRLTRQTANHCKRTLFELKMQRRPLDEIAERLHQEYGISPRTVKNWWANRESWEASILEIPDPDKMVKELLFERDLIKKHLWEIATTSNSDSNRLGALKLLLEGIPETLQMMHDLGLITKQAESIRFLTDSQATELVRIVSTALQDHPEAQKKLVGALMEYEEYERSNPQMEGFA